MSDGYKLMDNSHKHDPAWRHCQQFRHGDKVQLKCMFCARVFRGGGIHRMKEHLACQKGNASVCPRVPSDVRQIMQDSLNLSASRSTKKRKRDSGQPTIISSLNSGHSDDNNDTFANDCTIDVEGQLFGSPDVEDDMMITPYRYEGTSSVTEKRKRGRPPKNPIFSPGSQRATTGVLAPDSGEGHVVPSIVNGLEASPMKKTNASVYLAMGKFFYDVGIPTDAVNSIYFQQMIDALFAEGTRVLAPLDHDMRGWILKSVVDEVKGDLGNYAEAWRRTGCSVLVDECRSEKGLTFLNFFVYCPLRTIYLKSVDVTNIIGADEAMYELFKQVVEEVGVANVMQLITPNEECYSGAGQQLAENYPTLFWAPCASSSVMLILEDFGKVEWIHSTLEKCKSVTRFIYNHSIVLSMMRRCTDRIDLVVPDINPFVSGFKTVKRMVELRPKLESLVTSQEWVDSPYSKTDGGLALLDLISDHTFWSSCGLIVHITYPLLRLLNITTSVKKPAMGYVYAGMYRAKQMIKREFRKNNDYLAYWNIIDERWEQFQKLPLYAAGFYLNPKYFCGLEIDVQNSFNSAMLDCIEKLVPDIKIQDKISKELNSYKVSAGGFGRQIALRQREFLLPSEWWNTHGGDCPNLSRLAMRILSQCCSLIQCKRDLIPIEQMHSTSNSLERQRLTDQIFTQFNLRLRQMAQDKEHENVDLISNIHGSLSDWISRRDDCLDDQGSVDWLAIERSSNRMPAISKDEVEELGNGFGDYEIFGLKDEADN